MPYRHEKFSIAIGIIATLSLPLLSVASVENTFKNASNSFIVFGAKIDKTIAFTVSFPDRAVRYTTDIIELSASALANVADLAYRQARSTHHAARKEITNYKSQIKNTTQQVLSLASAPVSYLSSVKQGFLALQTGAETSNVKEESRNERDDGEPSHGGKPAIGEQLSSQNHRTHHRERGFRQ